MKANLHIHSLASDGKLTPDELIRLLLANKMDLVSLTDHDTMDNVPYFISLCEQHKIIAIPGVENSARTKTCFPILSDDQVHSFHILAFFPTAFNLAYLDRVKVFKSSKPSIYDTIEFIHELSGLAVFAHPQYGISKTWNQTSNKYVYDKIRLPKHIVEQVIDQCVVHHLDGIEAYYEDNTDEETTFLVEIARKHHLITSMGTDFHKSGDPIVSKYNDVQKYNFIFL